MSAPTVFSQAATKTPIPSGSETAVKNSDGGVGFTRWNVTVLVLLSYVTPRLIAAKAAALFVAFTMGTNGEKKGGAFRGTKYCAMIQSAVPGAPPWKSIERIVEYHTSYAVMGSPLENFIPDRM